MEVIKMNLNDLVEAVQELINADSAEAAMRVIQKHPELLSEEAIDQLHLLARMAEATGNNEVAEVLTAVAEMLKQLRQELLSSRLSEAKPTVSLSPEPSARWARLTRQYLALRKDELLQQAVETAEQAGEMDIANFLRAFQARDIETIDRMAPALHHSLRESGREEEAWTVALVSLDIRARLVEVFMHFPLEQQMTALEVGLEACKEATAVARALGDEPCTALYRAVAGNGYYRARRFEEAQGAYREALEIRRRLAKKEPQVYEPDVATTLNNLGNVLRDLRRFEEAEGAYREALEIYRRLADEEPQVYEPDVATTLNNLGLVLEDLRRFEEAEGAYREALEIYRRLADKEPQVYEPDVAMTLNNLGNVLRELRRFEEAEGAYREALGICRRLAEQMPQVYEPYVAMTLNNLGNVLEDLRRFEEAEGAYREALGICRRLAEQMPQVYEPYVAMTLNNLGNVLEDLRRFEEAEGAFREALEIYRRLAKKEPQVYEPYVAGTLNNLGNVLSDLRRFEEAEGAYREALEICRRLAEQMPQVYESDMAGTLNNLGNVLRDLRRFEEAEGAYREASEIYRRHDVPDQRAVLLSNLGGLQMEQERWEEAVETLREAVEQVERLRAEVLNLDRRERILRENIHIYERLLICLMKLRRYREALEVAERGKSRTLIDLLTLRDLRPHNAPPEVVEEYEQMLFRARALEDELRRTEGDGRRGEGERGRTAGEWEQMRQELTQTNNRLRELTTVIREYDPDFLPHAKPLTVDEIIALARDANTTLVLFRVTEAGSFVFLVFPDGETDVVEVPDFTTEALNELLVKFEDGEASDGWVVRYYEYQEALAEGNRAKALHAHQSWLEKMDETLRTLYQRLLKPVHERLKVWQRGTVPAYHPPHLVLVPNRGLAILPLHAC
jgi:tetratricopeptide (TPR) repeat protein